MPGFLLKPRWLGLLAFVVVFGAVCFRLGWWQWERHDDRIARNEIIREHFKADPVPIDQAVPAGNEVTEDTEWVSVTVTGTYDPKHTATVKFMQRDSAPGADVVLPLRLEDGTAILVDRGWIQTDNTGDRPDVPTPPEGDVTITGWLRPNSAAGGEAVRLNDGQIRAIDSAGFGESVPYDLRQGYLNLQTEDPQGADAPAVEPKPDLSQGVHFFYALQWWFFGMIGVVGFIWFAIAEARGPRRDDQASDTKSK